MLSRQSPVQYDFQRKGLEINVPALNQRIKECDAVFDRHLEDIRIQEFENRDPRLFIAALGESSHQAEPFFTFQFLSCDPFSHIQEFLRDQALQLPEGLLLKNPLDLLPFARVALAENQLAEILEQRARRVGDFLLQLFPALKTGQLRKLAARKLKELFDPVIDI